MTRLIKFGAFLCVLSVLLSRASVRAADNSSTTTTSTTKGADEKSSRTTSITESADEKSSTTTVRTTDSGVIIETAKGALISSTNVVGASVEAGTKQKYLEANDVPKCNASGSNLNDCLKHVFQTVLPRYKDGDRELNLPSLDPYSLNRTTFQYKGGVVGGRFTMLDAKVFGLAEIDYKTVDMKVKKGKTKVQMMTFIPRVSIVGRYKAAFEFNNARLRPTGTFNITLLDTSLDVNMDGQLYDKDGHSFVRLEKFDMEPDIGDLKVNATGIFPEHELNEIVVNIINQYWRDILRILFPEISRYWTPLFLKGVNEALSVVPFDNFVHQT